MKLGVELVCGFIAMTLAGCSTGVARNADTAIPSPVPISYPDQPEYRIKSIVKYPMVFESLAKSPVSALYEANRKDDKGIYQLYIGNGSTQPRCITCEPQPNTIRGDRHKMMVNWHPSGQWLSVGIEEDSHDNMWMPHSWQEGFMQCGIWLNMWLTTPAGDRWYQMTDYKKENGPANGFTGLAFTPDGKKAVWSEIVDGNIFVNKFGIWKLYIADFLVNAEGIPVLANKKEITPARARWVEPGNFSPDGRHLLLSTDIGLDDAQGQDQWSLDIFTGELKQLTHSPRVWDEHGIYSPDGRKIVFMSSYPYRNEPDTYKTLSLKTEFMMMDADGSHLQQLTHFNVPGYTESQPEHTIAAVAQFIDGNSKLLVTQMGPEFSKLAWIITFEGK